MAMMFDKIPHKKAIKILPVFTKNTLLTTCNNIKVRYCGCISFGSSWGTLRSKDCTLEKLKWSKMENVMKRVKMLFPYSQHIKKLWKWKLHTKDSARMQKSHFHHKLIHIKLWVFLWKLLTECMFQQNPIYHTYQTWIREIQCQQTVPNKSQWCEEVAFL